ncbi:hypothetical protein [Pyrobaculum ferrireducens]|uniref:Uncharacterized protein n=1 Tax=Pyrobaculum ferrireducens TaxID=1104324 RepID=G7VEY6_9CREN|nr:hypothetical protein [Pyrobaculum ferrireducens]AET34151.1 hypothetical protein P186_2775 [Pyrobaculum ferrireducens]
MKELEALLKRERTAKEAPPPPPGWRPRLAEFATVWRELGVKPLYPELYDMAVKTCRDWMKCYAMFIAVWETPHKWLLFEAAMAGLDTEMVARLILEGRIDEARRLVEP